MSDSASFAERVPRLLGDEPALLGGRGLAGLGLTRARRPRTRFGEHVPGAPGHHARVLATYWDRPEAASGLVAAAGEDA